MAQVVNGGTVHPPGSEVVHFRHAGARIHQRHRLGFSRNAPIRRHSSSVRPGSALRALCASDSDDCAEQGGDRDGARLYVADTLGNRIAVIDHPLGRTTSAGIGHTLSAGGSLNGPLG